MKAPNVDRCADCLVPVAQPHRLCRSCWAWIRFAHALQIIRTTREHRKVRA
jgi:predicted amidophosphoribosyltransferase